jgi:hypothetical protein
MGVPDSDETAMNGDEMAAELSKIQIHGQGKRVEDSLSCSGIFNFRWKTTSGDSYVV